MSREVVRVWWFNDVGIVKVKDTVIDEYRFYIGKCEGVSEKYDIQHIMDWGYQFNPKDIK